MLTDVLCHVMCLIVNPLLERVISIFDENKDNEIQFSEFITALSTFSDKDNKEGKLKCAFRRPFLH